MKTIYMNLMMLTMFMTSLNPALFAASLSDKIEASCQKYSEEEILSHKAPACTKAVRNYLKKVLQDKIQRNVQGVYAYLFLGLRLEVPEAYQIIEKEMYEGRLNTWIDKLQKEKKDIYEKSLVAWARHVESEVRKAYHVKQNTKAVYALASEEFESAPQLMSIWSPILMTRYLNLLHHKNYHVTKEDFNTLNVVYAFSNASFRDVFRDQTAGIISKASDKWVQSIREEQSWILFRIFPLIPKKIDGNMRRELIWLSHNHADFKIRTLASSILLNRS